jgi:hypothetical protein
VLRQLRESGSIVDKAVEGARAAHTAGRVAFVDSILLTSKFAKVTGVLGIVGGAYDMANPDHDGWRGVGDRGAGFLSAAGSSAALLATVGAIAPLGPVGAGIVAGALIVSAVWVGTNYVVDHWDDIKHGTATAARWVEDKTADAGRWAGGQAAKAWKGVKGLFS